ncbi:MAG: hypothetical protein UV73_C0003G0149 [Candidatus Gottesmanbacteria bacterium GW2011_GWA2_43_14]|uniref:Uncharacterized protein n=1 Tax=Candidatus Gottesmanbacteria bacterium GW2011_GWA2_43_14 TaxID=1618443 RepID=A0A0G1DKW7_9BACT|nr:MAG: hypothetical protein UV73_C0003G0149 [Candidatus Gottesmanbacteria bacterium GW2011_GWA2_43_14]
MNAFLEFLTLHTPLFYFNQSVWRDEAFSYFMAKPNLVKIIITTAQDFNPPLYYLLLHLWIYLAGHSDLGLRLLSLIFHLIGSYFAYLIGKKITDRKFAVFIFLFYLVNPMLLYYAFEMRMYSLYALMSTAALYFFLFKNWRGYTISAVLGLYSHTFFLMLPLSLAVHDYVFRSRKKQLFLILKPLLYFLPWLPVVAVQFVKSKESWIYPVDWQLVRSSLGNLFTGYQGTPWYFWKYTFIISLGIIFLGFSGLRKNKKTAAMFILPVILPLFLILSYSMVKRPIYVNRYLIFITVCEIFAVSFGIFALKKKTRRYLLAVSLFALTVYFNFYIVPFRKKTDFKSALREINASIEESDYIYTETPIAYLETAYYSQVPDKTFVYNPQNTAIPNYIGVNVIFDDVSRFTFPASFARTYLVKDDASFGIVVSD